MAHPADLADKLCPTVGSTYALPSSAPSNALGSPNGCDVANETLSATSPEKRKFHWELDGNYWKTSNTDDDDETYRRRKKRLSKTSLSNIKVLHHQTSSSLLSSPTTLIVGKEVYRPVLIDMHIRS